MGGARSTMEERIIAYRNLVEKPEEKSSFGRTRRRRGDNIKIDLQEDGCVYMDRIVLT